MGTISAYMFQREPNYYFAVMKAESLYQLMYFRFMLKLIDRIVHQVVFSNLLLFRNLSTLLDIFNLAQVISHFVALLLKGDLLHVLLHAIALLGYHSTCSLTSPDTVYRSWSPTGSLVSCCSPVPVS